MGSFTSLNSLPTAARNCTSASFSNRLISMHFSRISCGFFRLTLSHARINHVGNIRSSPVGKLGRVGAVAVRNLDRRDDVGRAADDGVSLQPRGLLHLLAILGVVPPTVDAGSETRAVHRKARVNAGRAAGGFATLCLARLSPRPRFHPRNVPQCCQCGSLTAGLRARKRQRQGATSVVPARASGLSGAAGYYRFRLFSCIDRQGGYFVIRLKDKAASS